MKIITALIFISMISMICLSLTVSVKRVKKNKNNSSSKVKSEGEGDYKNGYTIPGFLISKNFNFDENKKLNANAKFKPSNIETTPTDDDKLGWCFEMSDPTDEGLKSFMLKGKADKTWCIPYRLMTSQFGYTNPFGSAKFLFGSITTDSKEVYNLRVLLPYKTIGWYINDDEANKISAAVNVNRTKAIGNVKSRKSSVNTAAVSYTTNKPLLDSATAGAEKLKAEQAKLKSDLEKFQADSKAKQETFNTKATAIVESETKLNELKAAQNELAKEIQTLSSQIENINQALSLSTANTKPEELKSTYQKVVDSNVKDLDTAINNLKALAPPRNNDLDAAKKAVVEKSDLATLNANLSKVAPA